MLVAVTGTPGTGKSSACDVLARRGYPVVDLDELARKEGLVSGRDEIRETDEIDAILQEAVEHLKSVYEVDTTEATPQETAQAILGILQGKTTGHEPGTVDWTSEVLSWY